MQSAFEDDIYYVSNIVVYDKVSDNFIFFPLTDVCPNQILVVHHKFWVIKTNQKLSSQYILKKSK